MNNCVGFQIKRLDHLVLTVTSIEETVRFYEIVMGMSVIRFGADNARVALRFGQQKINLHEIGREFEPKAARPTAGSGDLCFIVDNFEAVAAHLAACGVEIIDGGGARAAVRQSRFGRSISEIPTRT